MTPGFQVENQRSQIASLEGISQSNRDYLAIRLQRKKKEEQRLIRRTTEKEGKNYQRVEEAQYQGFAEESRKWRIIGDSSVEGALTNGEGEMLDGGWKKHKNT